MKTESVILSAPMSQGGRLKAGEHEVFLMVHPKPLKKNFMAGEGAAGPLRKKALAGEEEVNDTAPEEECDST